MPHKPSFLKKNLPRRYGMRPKQKRRIERAAARHRELSPAARAKWDAQKMGARSIRLFAKGSRKSGWGAKSSKNKVMLFNKIAKAAQSNGVQVEAAVKRYVMDGDLTGINREMVRRASIARLQSRYRLNPAGAQKKIGELKRRLVSLKKMQSRMEVDAEQRFAAYQKRRSDEHPDWGFNAERERPVFFRTIRRLEAEMHWTDVQIMVLQRMIEHRASVRSKAASKK